MCKKTNETIKVRMQIGESGAGCNLLQRRNGNVEHPM